MRLDIVLPRYGTYGGAERVLASIARELMARRDWKVEVHTTCATSASTWRNEHPPGTVELEGVTVHRHKVDRGRSPSWPVMNEALEASLDAFDEFTEFDYLGAQGPVSYGLAEAIKHSDADVVLFKPYLYWTTAVAARDCNKPTIIWPAAHDETYVRMRSMGNTFLSADGLIFGSEAERRLVHSCHNVTHLRQLVLGCGIDVCDGEPADAAKAIGIDADRPWVLCLGRIEYGKGAPQLYEMWNAYAATHPVEHQLVMVGENVASLTSSDGVTVVDGVDEATKWGLLRGADVLVHPSRLESFGMVVTEAWAAGTPVLVNGLCGPTFDHVRQSGGGMWFLTKHDFADAMNAMLSDDERRAQMAAAGQRFAAQRYSWDQIISRFTGFCERIVRFSPRAQHKPA